MRSQTIRLGILVSTFIIVAIVIFQLVWLRNVYNFEQREFDHRINRSIRGFYEDVHRSTDSFLLLSKQIRRVNDQTYLFYTEQLQRTDSMSYFIRNELDEENINTDCYLGFFDPLKAKFVYTLLLKHNQPAREVTLKLQDIPSGKPHIILYFPYRTQYILGLMNFWIISGALLLIVLVLFSGSVYYFYRQKFLNEMQKDFVNNFTHEFKTPVSVINLAAEVLENPDIIGKPERLSKYAGIVRYQGKYLQQQIERLLKHAYAESNHLHLQLEQVNLHLLIEEALESLQPLVIDKHAHVNCHFHAVKFQVMADSGYLLIVLINLIENSLKYAQNPNIIINTTNEAGAILISVKDNGKGIEKKYLNKIFMKFYRVPNEDQMSARGFGLGLSFVRKIIQAHHGKIHVESIPGIGSNFIIRIPLT